MGKSVLKLWTIMIIFMVMVGCESERGSVTETTSQAKQQQISINLMIEKESNTLYYKDESMEIHQVQLRYKKSSENTWIPISHGIKTENGWSFATYLQKETSYDFLAEATNSSGTVIFSATRNGVKVNATLKQIDLGLRQVVDENVHLTPESFEALVTVDSVVQGESTSDFIFNFFNPNGLSYHYRITKEDGTVVAEGESQSSSSGVIQFTVNLESGVYLCTIETFKDNVSLGFSTFSFTVSNQNIVVHEAPVIGQPDLMIDETAGTLTLFFFATGGDTFEYTIESAENISSYERDTTIQHPNGKTHQLAVTISGFNVQTSHFAIKFQAKDATTEALAYRIFDVGMETSTSSSSSESSSTTNTGSENSGEGDSETTTAASNDQEIDLEIAEGVEEFSVMFDVPEAGLYKAHIEFDNIQKTNASLSSIMNTLTNNRGGRTIINSNTVKEIPHGDLRIYSHIDKEDTVRTLKSQNSIVDPNVAALMGESTAVLQDVSAGTYSSWIASTTSLDIDNKNGQDFYFFVDDQYVPIDGKLQFRLQIEDWAVCPRGYTCSPREPVVGRVKVTHDQPYVVNVDDSFTYDDGEVVSYDTVKLPSVEESEMEFSVIKTSMLEIKKHDNSYDSPLVTFFLSGFNPLSSTAASSNTNGLVSLMASQNKDIYQEILGDTFSQSYNMNYILSDYAPLDTKCEYIKDESWDLLHQNYPSVAQKGLKLCDGEVDKTTSVYSAIVTNKFPSEMYELETFMTQGYLTGGLDQTVLTESEKVNNEIVVATRNSLPMKWSYVVELSELTVSEQSETDKDGDDTGHGEFSLINNIILTEAIRAESGSVALEADQIITDSSFFPMGSKNIKFLMRSWNSPTGKESPRNKGAMMYPSMPVFVMDYDKLQNYNEVAISTTVVEYDKLTWWQKHGAMIKAFVTYAVSAVASAVTENPGYVLQGFYDLASQVLDNGFAYKGKVDDMMGVTALLAVKDDNFGLSENGDSVSVFSAKGPERKDSFFIVPKKENGTEVQISQSSSNVGRSIDATYRLRRIPQLDSMATIRLLNYTPTYSIYGNENIISEKHSLIEGYYSDDSEEYPRYDKQEISNIEAYSQVKVSNGLTIIDAYNEMTQYSRDIHRIIKNPYPTGTISPMQKITENWEGKGFSYYQAAIEDQVEYTKSFYNFTGQMETVQYARTAEPYIVSFTLYHNDVLEAAANPNRFKCATSNAKGECIAGITAHKIGQVELDQEFFEEQVEESIALHISENYDIYRANIQLADQGDWLHIAEFLAYVFVRK